MNPISATDYKANDIKGKQRIYGGKFFNPLDGIPSIMFEEELITYDSATDTVFRNAVGSCQTELVDPAKELTLRNPIDDSAIGTATYADVMVMLYSLGRQVQLERDAALLAQQQQAQE